MTKHINGARKTKRRKIRKRQRDRKQRQAETRYLKNLVCILLSLESCFSGCLKRVTITLSDSLHGHYFLPRQKTNIADVSITYESQNTDLDPNFRRRLTRILNEIITTEGNPSMNGNYVTRVHREGVRYDVTLLPRCAALLFSHNTSPLTPSTTCVIRDSTRYVNELVTMARQRKLL